MKVIIFICLIFNELIVLNTICMYLLIFGYWFACNNKGIKLPFLYFELNCYLFNIWRPSWWTNLGP